MAAVGCEELGFVACRYICKNVLMLFYIFDEGGRFYVN